MTTPPNSSAPRIEGIIVQYPLGIYGVAGGGSALSNTVEEFFSHRGIPFRFIYPLGRGAVGPGLEAIGFLAKVLRVGYAAVRIVIPRFQRRWLLKNAVEHQQRFSLMLQYLTDEGLRPSDVQQVLFQVFEMVHSLTASIAERSGGTVTLASSVNVFAGNRSMASVYIPEGSLDGMSLYAMAKLARRVPRDHYCELQQGAWTGRVGLPKKMWGRLGEHGPTLDASEHPIEPER